jgi:hypothetical protein
MLHLDPERLAALTDSDPTADERAHLEACDYCAREHAAYRALGSLAAAQRNAIGEPITHWEELAPRLRADGLLATQEPPTKERQRPWMQAAAAVLLVVGGARRPAHRASDLRLGRDQAPASGTANRWRTHASNRVTRTSPSPRAPTAPALCATPRDVSTAAAIPLDRRGGFCRSGTVPDATGGARQDQRRRAGSGEQCSHDPVINQYSSTVSARQVTFISSAAPLPAGVRLVGY